jgi:hypothetical protein
MHHKVVAERLAYAIVNSLSDQRSQPASQPAFLTILYQVAEDFHAFTVIITILLFLCIGKMDQKMQQQIDCKGNTSITLHMQSIIKYLR